MGRLRLYPGVQGSVCILHLVPSVRSRLRIPTTVTHALAGVGERKRFRLRVGVRGSARARVRAGALRPYFLHDRRRLGKLSQIAYRTLREYMRAALGEPDAAPGAIVCNQSFGSLAHWHPHLHILLTDGTFRDDGSFIASPAHDPTVLEAAWQRAVLAWFVDHRWLDEDAATAMFGWPHSGFGAHIGPVVHADDRDGLRRDRTSVA